MNKKQHFQLMRDPTYISVIEILDKNSDYVMPGAYPKHIYDKGVETIRQVLVDAHEIYGQEVYNDLLEGFELPKIDWLSKNT